MFSFSSGGSICPYCYQKSNKKLMQLGCTNGSCKQKIDKNKPGKNYFEQSQGSNCPECGAKLKYICPNCDQPLEDLMIDTKEKDMFPLAMVGLKNAGKSNYVAVAIQELYAKGGRIGLNTIAMNQDTSTRYRNDFYSYVYKMKQAVPQTLAMESKAQFKPPLIYKILVSDTKSHKIRSNLLLSFYDTAGENLSRSDEDTELHASYISHAQGIILLVDPWQIPGVQEKLAEAGIHVPDAGISCREMIERVIRMIRKCRNFGETQKIDIPIAVVFSKVDSFLEYDLVNPDSCLCHDSRHLAAGCYLRSEHQDTNSQMKDFLERWTEGTDSQGIVDLLESHFVDCAFFGVSAFGGGTDQYGKLKDAVSPIRVLDPFLWLLYKNKTIKMK